MEAAFDEVAKASEEYLLNVPEKEFVAYLVDKYGMGVPTLRREDATTIGSGTATRDAYGNRFSAATTRIPFDGPAEIFGYQPNLYGPMKPEAEIHDGALLVYHRFNVDQLPDFEAEIGQFMGRVQTYFPKAEWQARDHTERLERELTGVITNEKQSAIAARAALAKLTIPVRDRPGAPTTYAVPGIERRPAPAPPVAASGGAPKPIEPRLIADFFEHIVGVIRSTGKAMERTPGTFAEGSETQKRDVLLVMLNSHYQGAAAGEVFNGAGKADIVLRLADHNLLVAECKFWSGIKSFGDALAQLRDTSRCATRTRR